MGAIGAEQDFIALVALSITPCWSLTGDVSYRTRGPSRNWAPRTQTKLSSHLDGRTELHRQTVRGRRCAKSVPSVLGSQSGAVFAAIVNRGEDVYAIAVVADLLRITDRSRIMTLCEQEHSIKKLAELVRSNPKIETVFLNTLVSSSASAGGIERANQEVAKQCRTQRSDTEEVCVAGHGTQARAMAGAPCSLVHPAFLAQD